MKRTLIAIAVATMLFAIAPFLVYQYELSQGILTSADDWYSQGTNHGPWRWELSGFLIFEPQILLFAAGLLAAFITLLEERKKSIVLAFLALGLLQVPILLVQLYYLGWLID